MNCLVTAIGSFSAEAVIASLKKNKITKIIGCDIYPCTWIPTSALVDTFYQVPSVFEDDLYINGLIEIIVKEKINFIIPLTDPEVDILSKYRHKIETYNVSICMSNNESIGLCRNKLAFYDFFNHDHVVNLIPTFEPLNYPLRIFGFPIVAKPRSGRSSEGVFIIDSNDELQVKQRTLQNYIFQPQLKGNIYTVDLIRDHKHNKSFSISREELIRTKNGAGLSVEISYNEYLTHISQHIGEKLKINGCINIEFIFCNNKYYLMDINPRFSAGVAFSIIAGYDMVINHLNCFNDTEIQNEIKFKTMTIARKLTEVITQVNYSDNDK